MKFQFSLCYRFAPSLFDFPSEIEQKPPEKVSNTLSSPLDSIRIHLCRRASVISEKCLRTLVNTQKKRNHLSKKMFKCISGWLNSLDHFVQSHNQNWTIEWTQTHTSKRKHHRLTSNTKNHHHHHHQSKIKRARERVRAVKCREQSKVKEKKETVKAHAITIRFDSVGSC